jgi:hypothetical protein
MTLFQTAVMVPVLAIGATFDSHHASAAAAHYGERTLSAPHHADVKAELQTRFVLQRKARIQNVLLQLDHIAEVTAQMKPETADRVEPVIVDLAEQTIDLANEKALRSSETDSALTKIEATVGQLGKTMNRYIEPEANL